MKHVSLLILVGAALLGIAPVASAQQHPTKPTTGKVSVINSDSISAAQIYREFAEVAPKAFNIPNAPGLQSWARIQNSTWA
ncbi:MAG: hypothetical protein LIP03_14795 [Bacteroidales bacterium]|nr:hypothetical protein [Bacteroidales bacterium]